MDNGTEKATLTPFEAGTRFAGVALLAAIAYLHLLDLPHKVDDGVWYMVVLFVGLITGAAVLAVALVRIGPERVRWAWRAAAALAIGALCGYALSRLVPFPGQP